MTMFTPLCLVVLCTLKVTLGAPTFKYIVNIDPLNNQPYVPLVRFGLNMVRNVFSEITKPFSEPSTVSPGYSSQQPNYLGDQVNQATHLISDEAHSVAKTAWNVGNALSGNTLQNTKEMMFPTNHAPVNVPYPITVQLPGGGSTVLNEPLPSTVALPTPASLSPSAVQLPLATAMNLASTNPYAQTAANVPAIGAASVAAPKTAPEKQVQNQQMPTPAVTAPLPSTVALPAPASLSPSAVQSPLATATSLASTNPDAQAAANVPAIGAASVAAPKTAPEKQVQNQQTPAVTAPVTISNPPNPPATLSITNSTKA